MIAYTTVSEAKTHLRVDGSDSDTEIQNLIYAASSSVKNYLKSTSPYDPERDADDNPLLDSNGDPDLTDTIRPEVRIATLLLVGEWYKNREAEQAFDLGHGYLPAPVVAILYPLRDPTLA